MSWSVEYTDEFEAWWDSLTESEQDSVAVYVLILEQKGPSLSFPYSSGIKRSRHGHLRELRVQHQGRPIRVLYAFDPRRVAVLLIGGLKKGQDRWYQTYVRLADEIYDDHLLSLKKEGLI